MKTSELRIGNLIKYRWAAIKVDSINGDGINLKPEYNYTACQDSIISRLKLKEIQGIPITEDLLLKFGFYEDQEVLKKQISNNFCLFWEDDVIQLCLEWRPDSLNIWNNIKYFHQLQNLYYSLTGEELTITPPH